MASQAIGGRVRLRPALENLRDQFESVTVAARELVQDRSEEQLLWRPDAASWSILECLDHLGTVGEQYLARLEEGIARAPACAVGEMAPLRLGLFERLFVWLMEPPARLKVKRPSRFPAPRNLDSDRVMQDFFNTQEKYLVLLQRADGVDVYSIKVASAVTRHLKFTLPGALAVMVAHERRHLWQAMAVARRPGFPRS